MTIGLLVVGSPVIVSDPNHKPRRTSVERVGRKYVYVRGEKAGFCRETGRINDDWGNTYLYTVEEYDAKVAEATARRELWDFGIRVENSIPRAVLLEIREALSTIVPRAAQPSSVSPDERTTEKK